MEINTVNSIPMSSLYREYNTQIGPAFNNELRWPATWQLEDCARTCLAHCDGAKYSETQPFRFSSLEDCPELHATSA